MRSGPACPKCGTTKVSGRRSCCAGGGAWFKNCGHSGDTKFDHTWAEGIQACKSMLSSTWFCTLYAGSYHAMHGPGCFAVTTAMVSSRDTAASLRTTFTAVLSAAMTPATTAGNCPITCSKRVELWLVAVLIPVPVASLKARFCRQQHPEQRAHLFSAVASDV